MIVCTSVATVFAKPDFMSEQVDEMLYGEEAEIIDKKDGFYKIVTEYGYNGWVAKQHIFGKFQSSNYIVVSHFADLLAQGKFQKAPYMWLPMGARVNAQISQSDVNFAFVNHPIEHTFYIHKNHISPIDTTAKTETELREAIIRTAKKYLGAQYRWGGRTYMGIDCSGLCFNAYKFNNINIWRDADIEKSPNLRPIDIKDADSGDLIFFKGHMAIYLGEGQIIHSSAKNGIVAIENLNNNKNLQEILICAGTAF